MVSRTESLADFFSYVNYQRITMPVSQTVCMVDTGARNLDNHAMQRIDPFYKRFGATFKQHRERRKLTQDDVAKAIGLSRTSITNIECGRQKILLHQVFDLAQIVEVPPSALLIDLTPSSGDGNVERAIAAARPKVKNARELEWIKKTIAGDKPAGS